MITTISYTGKMKKIILLSGLILLNIMFGYAQDAQIILNRIDKNMVSKTEITESEMVIRGKRNVQTIGSKSYTEGNKKSFTEYLYPERERGTKMLKLEDRLWIYSPSTDRTIQLSGHMLRQSVMGSDLSYEDMMEDRKLKEIYDAIIVGEETIDERKTWILELTASVEDVSYYKRKIWVDQERFIPLKEELFAKSGQLLKKTTLSDISQIDGRWYPKKINFKDVLKSGNGTDFIIKKIQFNPAIPAYIFTKASLKK
jgi:outer membrane lipoprotein-sorting protein